MKKQKNKKIVDRTITLAVAAVLSVILGFVVGLLWRSGLATPRQIEAAKNQVVLNIAEERIVGACPEGGDKVELKMGKIVPNYRNIKINKYANRAIVTDCAERDELFVKTQDGFWDPTNKVNLQLSNRANPVWLKECLIDDIVVADEIIRQENSSIDAMNLKECKRIKSL